MYILYIYCILYIHSILSLIYLQKRGTRTAFYTGYGIILPLAACAPFFLLEYLQVRNKTLKCSLGTSGAIPFFRCLEAMYGTSPHTVEHSVRTYMEYYTALTHFEWNPKTKTRRLLTIREAWDCLVRTASHFHLLSLVVSIGLHCNFSLFDSPVVVNEYHITWDLLRPAHLANSYFMAVAVFLHISTTFELASLPDNLQGYYTQPIFHNPLFCSRSPSDFWGRRWNMTIHRMVKHGVFLPAQKYLPVSVAMLLAFLGSGLIHEYCWATMFYNFRDMHNADGVCVADDCYHPRPFKVLAFFLYNAVLVLLEKQLGGSKSWIAKTTRSWPTPLVSTLVVLLSLPVAHWFYGDWAMGGYMREFAIGYVYDVTWKEPLS